MAEKKIYMGSMERNKSMQILKEMQDKRLELSGTMTDEDVAAYQKLLFGDYDGVLAVLDNNKMQNILLSNNMKIIQGFNDEGKASKYKDNTNFKTESYGKLYTQIADSLLSKNNTSSEFMWKATKAAEEFTYAFNSGVRSSMSMEDIRKSRKYMEKNRGITVFDLETFGGINEFGKQEVDKITEFAFSKYDGLVAGASPTSVSKGFVGLTEDEARRYMEEFADIKDFNSLTSKQQVTARSLAKIGHSNTVIEEDGSKAGRFFVKAGANPEDVVVNSDSIMRGIQKARDVGMKQEISRRKDGLLQWEKDLADSIIDMQNGKGTIAGHNIVRADIPWLNQFMATKASPSMRGYLESAGLGNGLTISKNRILDTLPILQHAAKNSDFFKDLWPEGDRTILADGHTRFQQEALMKKFLGDYVNNSGIGAHIAEFDVTGFYKLMTEPKINGSGIFEHAFQMASEVEKGVTGKIKANGTQLWYSSKSLGGNLANDGLMGFKIDPFDGKIRTMDGYEVNNGKAVKTNGFSEWLTKKGVSYKIDNMINMETNEEFIDMMKQINPSLSVKGLVGVQLTPVTRLKGKWKNREGFEDAPLKNTASSFIVGTREEIESHFNNDMILYGEVKDGKIHEVAGARNLLQKHLIESKDEKFEPVKGSTEEFINSVVRDGTIANTNDSAARMVREMDFNKYMNFSTFSNEVNRRAAEDRGPGSEKYKKARAIEQMVRSSSSIAKQVAAGQSVKIDDKVMAESLQSILGYVDFSTGRQAVNPKTVDNAISALRYFEDMENVLSPLYSTVSGIGKNKAEKNFLFRQGLDAIAAEAEKYLDTSFNQTQGFVRGFEKSYFEVDVSKSFKNKRGTVIDQLAAKTDNSGILRINLDGSEQSLINKLVENRSANSEIEAKKKLSFLIDDLQENSGLLKNFYGITDKDNPRKRQEAKAAYLKQNSAGSFARDILDSLKGIRKEDPTAGYLTPAQIHKVVDGSDLSFARERGMTDEKITDVLKNRFKGFKSGTIFDMTDLTKDENAFRAMTANIVDNILMDKVSRDQLAKYGYSENQMNKLEKYREIRRKDYMSYTEQLLKGVGNTTAGLVVDQNTGTFGLIQEGRFVDLAGVPRDKFSDGMFYTQIGRNRVAAELHFDVKDSGQKYLNASDVSLKSGLGIALKDSWNLKGAIDNARRRGDDPGQLIEQWVSGLARTIREGSSVTSLDEQDIKSQFEVYDKQIVNNLNKIQGLEQLDLMSKEAFIERVSRKGFSFDSMQDADKQLYSLNRSEILRHIANNISTNEDIKDIAYEMSNRSKNSAASAGRFRTTGVYQEMEIFNNASRGIDAATRYLSYREDDALSRLDELGVAGKVGLGAHLRTATGHGISTRVLDGTSVKSYSEFTMDRVSLGADTFQKKILEGHENFTTSQKYIADKLLMTGNLVEAGAIANSRIADAIFQNYDRQKVSLNRELFLDHIDNLERIKAINAMREVTPTFTVDAGEINFKYSKGRYVKEGDKLFDEKTYGGSISPIGAKYEGALRMGFFTKAQGVLATESEVIKTVKEHAAKSGLEVTDIDSFMNIARGQYDASFYVERLKAEPYRKLQEDRLEKHMVSFAYMGLGDSGNKGIKAALDNLGLGHLSGRVLSREFFEELSNGKGISDSFINQLSGKDLTEKTYLGAIQKAGFANEKAFGEALEKERHKASDFLTERLGADIALFSEDESHKNRSMPIMMAANEMIEKETQSILGSNFAMARQEAEALAAKRVAKDLDGVFVKDGKSALSVNNGKIEVPEFRFHDGDYIDTAKLKTAFNKKLGDDNAYDEMMMEGKVTRHSYALVKDYTGMSGSGALNPDSSNIEKALAKGFKVGDREINMMEMSRLDQTMIDRAAAAVKDPDEFNKMFGFAVNKVDGKYVLKDEFANTPLMGGTIERVRSGLYAKPGEELAIQNGKMIGSIPEELRASAQSLHDVSGGDVSIKSAEKLYSVGANTAAMRFNEGKLSKETLMNSQYKFEEMDLRNIDRATGKDGSYLLNDSPNSIFNKNVIINLEDDIIDSSIINRTESGSKFLAIGRIPTGMAGEELIQSAPYKEINAIMSARSKLQNSQNLTEDEIERHKQTIVTSIDGFNRKVSETVTGKDGMMKDLSELRLNHSAMGKASLMNLNGILEMGGSVSALENAFVDGKSLMDYHREGKLMDFKIVSRDHVEKMGLFDKDYLKKVDMTAEEMEKSLKSGVMALTHRNPTVYEGSIKPTTLILSDSFTGTQSVEYAAGALTAKTDADGDNVKTALLEMRDSKGNYVDSIQYKNNANIDEHAKQGFQMAKGAMYHNALVRNKFFEDRLKDDLSEIHNIDKELTSRLTSINAMNTDIMRPGLDRLATEAESAKYLKDYNVVQSRALDMYAKEHKVDVTAASEMFIDKTSIHSEYLRKAVNEYNTPEQRAQYGMAAEHHIRNMEFIASNLSPLKQSSAGEINLPLYKVRKVRSLSHETLSRDENRMLEHILEASEEAFLSPKHSEAKMINNATTMIEFNRAFRSVTGSPLHGDSAGTQLMTDWFEKNLPGRYKPTKVIDGLIHTGDEVVFEKEDFQKASSLIQKVFSNNDNIANYNLFMGAVGQYSGGVNTRFIDDMLIAPKQSTDLLASTYDALSRSHKEAGYRLEELITSNSRLYDKNTEILQSNWSPPTSSGLKDTSKNLLEATKTRIKEMNLTGKDLAFGALGLAGATMMLGFVGGDPSKPTTTMAASAAGSEDLYSIPMMTDDASGIIQANPNKGYIININANSPKGQAHAERAISQAMSQSYTSTNVNVSMNIRNEQGNITDRTIQDLLQGAFA